MEWGDGGMGEAKWVGRPAANLKLAYLLFLKGFDVTLVRTAASYILDFTS